MSKKLLVGMAFALALTLTSCTAADKLAMSPTPSASHESTPAPDRGSESTPVPVDSQSTGAPPQADSVPQLGGIWAKDLVDTGPREGALGTATINGAGIAVSYEVVEGDIWDDVAARFGASEQYYINLNSVNRENAFDLYVGDIINLDPHTITTVGTQNGQSFGHLDRLASPHPEQH